MDFLYLHFLLCKMWNNYRMIYYSTLYMPFHTTLESIMQQKTLSWKVACKEYIHLLQLYNCYTTVIQQPKICYTKLAISDFRVVHLVLELYLPVNYFVICFFLLLSMTLSSDNIIKFEKYWSTLNSTALLPDQLITWSTDFLSNYKDIDISS